MDRAARFPAFAGRISRRQLTFLSKGQLAESPVEISIYLKALREGPVAEWLKRVRAVFIGHGEVGKTSLTIESHGG